ncbi:MAG: PQQ-binding-like beta-propeller repeat protein [Deltaproteobacteria bacterium]|nr:PQQ-binding-like beta-propeller repeat protein [Deltaproteobacteria bacterium]
MPKVCSRMPFDRSLCLLAVLFALAGCAAKPLPTGELKPWTTGLADEARSNVSPDKIGAPLVAAWTKDASAWRLLNRYAPAESSSPALAGGVLYTGSDAGKVYAIDLASGGALWSFDADYPVGGAPGVADGKVCFGAANGVFRCLEAASGRELWRFQAKSGIVSSPLIKDGRVWFTSSDDRLHALSLDKGERLWTYTRGTYQTVAPELPLSSAWHDGNIYQLFSDGFVVALAAGSGKQLWEKRVVANFDSTNPARRVPLIHDGLVYVINAKNAVEALDPRTGASMAVYDAIAAYDFVMPGDRTLVVAGSGAIAAIDTVTGAVLWRRGLAHKPASSIFAAGDLLFILSNFKTSTFDISWFEKTKGHIEAAHLLDGKTAWEAELDSTLSARGASAYGRAAFLADNGVVRVYSAQQP